MYCNQDDSIIIVTETVNASEQYCIWRSIVTVALANSLNIFKTREREREKESYSGENVV